VKNQSSFGLPEKRQRKTKKSEFFETKRKEKQNLAKGKKRKKINLHLPQFFAT
jgi:hypothetical protein